MKFRIIVVAIVLLAIGVSLAFADQYTEKITRNLDSAKANRSELEKTIGYFEKKGDAQQLDAVRFLIANMDDACYSETAIFDSNKVEIAFNILDYPNIDSASKALEAIEKKRGRLKFDRKQLVFDLETMKADLLIRNVEQAFSAWKTRPWSKTIPYSDFRDYILPYRGSNEPIEDWRTYFIDKYRDLPKTMKDSTDPIEAATLINRELAKIFTFDSRYYLHPTDLGLTEMLKTHLGRCEDMTNFTIFALRANGICVVSDYTPYWANSGNNHAWNAVMDRDGKAIPFMGCEADPKAYKLSGKIGKAYRKSFGHQRDNLSAKLNKNERSPGWLSGDEFIDVTKDYATIADVSLKLTDPIPDSVRFAYLCVFNSGEWKPIHWSWIKGKKTNFTAMGCDVMYAPAFYYKKKPDEKAKLETTGSAFILTHRKLLGIFPQSGKCITLDGDTANKISVALWSTTKKVYANATEEKRIAALDSGATYELSYWDKEWKSLGKKLFSDKSKPLVFDNVPANRVYWLVKDIVSDEHEERIFTIDPQGAQVWW